MKLLDNITFISSHPSLNTTQLFTICSDDYKYMCNFRSITQAIDAYQSAYPVKNPAALAKLPHLAENFSTMKELQQLIPEYFI